MKKNMMRFWISLLTFVPALVFAESEVTAASPKLFSDAVRADIANTTVGKGAALIGFKQSGSGAVARTVLDKEQERISVRDFGAACDGVSDDTTTIQNAINYTSSIGAALHVPPGTCLGNWVLKTDTTIIGASQNTTIFKPVADAPVFSVSATSSTVRLRLERFGITGNHAFPNQDGIALNPVAASTFVDTVYIDSVWILNSGKNGIYTHGTSSAGPFVQSLRIDHSYIAGSVQEGLYMDGDAFECVFTNLWAVNNGSNIIPNVTIGSKTLEGHAPYRVTWIGGGLNQATVTAASRYISDLVTTATSATVTSATANFTRGDIGKYIAVHNGNTYGQPLITTIRSVTNSTIAVLASAVNVANSGAKAIINLGVGGTINIQHAKQIKFIGCDFENAGVYVVVSGTLQQDLSIDSSNFSSNYPVLATVWAQGNGGDGLFVRNINTANTSKHFYNLLTSDSTGALLALANQLKNVDFPPTTNPPSIAHMVMYDYQNATSSVIIYHRNIEFIRVNGTAAVNKLLDSLGGTTGLMRGQRMTLFANNGFTVNRYTTNSGNINIKSGANVVLAAGESMTLQWDDISGLWFER